jgi:hypothetical protein
MRALCLAILLCSACTKKPAAKTPTTAPATDEKQPDNAQPPPPPTPATVTKPGDPCSGGEAQ